MTSRKDTSVCGRHAPRDGQEFSGRTRCMRQLVAARTHAVPATRRPPATCTSRPPLTHRACPCRCPTNDVPLARRAHTHSACHTAIPSHMYVPPRPAHGYLPAAQTLPAHGDPQRHVRPTTPTPKQTRVIAGLVHRHAQQRDGSIAHTGTSGTTPHGKNESIARAGIERKHEWHDTARQKQEHRTRWYQKEAGVARHRTAKTRASHATEGPVIARIHAGVIWHDHPTHAAAGYGR